MPKKLLILVVILALITLVILVIIVIRFSGDSNGNQTQPGNININPDNYCQTSKDCLIGGCSSQICYSIYDEEGGVSNCFWQDEYACYVYSSCSCVNSQCRWEETAKYQACLKDPSNYSDPIPRIKD